jgi:uncharacterized membrane protein
MATDEDEQLAVSGKDNSLGRLLTLSDGVFAIAMTLLALDLRVPDLHDATNASLQHALRHQVPNYLSFLISFCVVASYWRRHRRLMRSVEIIDSALIDQTVLLLLLVAAMPFPAPYSASTARKPSRPTSMTGSTRSPSSACWDFTTSS